LALLERHAGSAVENRRQFQTTRIDERFQSGISRAKNGTRYLIKAVTNGARVDISGESVLALVVLNALQRSLIRSLASCINIELPKQRRFRGTFPSSRQYIALAGESVVPSSVVTVCIRNTILGDFGDSVAGIVETKQSQLTLLGTDAGLALCGVEFTCAHAVPGTVEPTSQPGKTEVVLLDG